MEWQVSKSAGVGNGLAHARSSAFSFKLSGSARLQLTDGSRMSIGFAGADKIPASVENWRDGNYL